MKKQRNPKETKPEPPYLAVWFEVYKIGDSVRKKGMNDPKAYVREPRCYYFPAGYTAEEAIKEIHEEYGSRDTVSTLHAGHSFAMIHGHRKTGESEVILPIK